MMFSFKGDFKKKFLPLFICILVTPQCTWQLTELPHLPPTAQTTCYFKSMLNKHRHDGARACQDYNLSDCVYCTIFCKSTIFDRLLTDLLCANVHINMLRLDSTHNWDIFYIPLSLILTQFVFVSGMI